MNLDSLKEYCELVQAATGISAAEINKYATDSLSYFGSDRNKQAKVKQTRTLERDWYNSLPNPDFSLYGRKDFLGDLWACWQIYSKRYVKMIKPILQSHGIKSIVDVGNGIGYSTAFLCETMPELEVFGTNLPGYQMDVCLKMAERYKFRMVGEKESFKVGAIFASEYFEHFESPCDHLGLLNQKFLPRMIICANAFGAESFGHFPKYKVNHTRVVSNKAIGREFGVALRAMSFSKVETKFWNNRPAIYFRP